jgi:hypothetical protein
MMRILSLKWFFYYDDIGEVVVATQHSNLVIWQ